MNPPPNPNPGSGPETPPSAVAGRSEVRLSVLGLLLMVAGLMGLLTSRSLFSPLVAVIVAQVAAVVLLLWARVTFGMRSFHAGANPTEGGLVTTGPYRFVRHPIYTAVCLFAWAGAAAHPTAASAGWSALVFAGGWIRMKCEEKLVTRRYPEYRDYAARTRRMIPGIF